MFESAGLADVGLTVLFRTDKVWCDDIESACGSYGHCLWPNANEVGTHRCRQSFKELDDLKSRVETASQSVITLPEDDIMSTLLAAEERFMRLWIRYGGLERSTHLKAIVK